MARYAQRDLIHIQDAAEARARQARQYLADPDPYVQGLSEWTHDAFLQDIDVLHREHGIDLSGLGDDTYHELKIAHRTAYNTELYNQKDAR